jgi:outer membrane protein
LPKTKLKSPNYRLIWTEKLVRAGTLATSSLLDLKAQLANEESNVVSFQSTLDLNRLTLVQSLNDANMSVFDLERIQVPVPSAKAYGTGISDIYAKAVAAQPLVRAADFRVQSAAKSVEVAKAFRLPSLSLNGSWSAQSIQRFKVL